MSTAILLELIRPRSHMTMLADLLQGLEDAMRRLGYREEFRRAVAQRLENCIRSAEQIGGRVDFSTWPEYLGLEPSVMRAAQPLVQRMAKAAAREMLQAVLIQVVIPELIELVDGDSSQDPPGGGQAA